MTSNKKKIEAYEEAEQIGKEEKEPAIEDEKEKPDKQKSQKDAPDSEKTVESEIESLKQEAKENYDKLLRVSAEFDNYKKRTIREMGDLRKYANEAFLRDMLTVVDNLERAVESSNAHAENNTSIVEGVRMTLKGIADLMEKCHVTPIESVGKPFDPQFHQAFHQEESEDHPNNTVLKEFQKGYMLHDRLLRPAMVIVSKTKEANAADKTEACDASKKE